MEEGIFEACAKLRLTEEELGTITLEDVVDDNADEIAEMSLVGRILTHKPYNINHMKSALTSAWRLAKGFTIRDIGDELFVCEFVSKNDRNRILREGPWNFDKQTILLEPMSGNMQPNNMIIKYCPTWIRIYNLPMNCRGQAALSKIGTKVGRVLEVDCESGGYNRYGRVRVLMDVSKAMIRGTKVINPLGEQCWIPFKYERIQKFCYWCGMMDHVFADCEDKPEETEVSDWPYGPSLRATPRKRSMMGNRASTNSRNTRMYNDGGSGSTSTSGGASCGVRRGLNLNQEEDNGFMERLGVEEQQQVHVQVSEKTRQLDETGIVGETVGDLIGLVDVRVVHAQVTDFSENVVQATPPVQAKMGKKGGREVSWTRNKAGRGTNETGGVGSSKTVPTKRNRGEAYDGDSDDLFSKKVRDGLTNRFENFEISAGTDEQSRRMP